MFDGQPEASPLLRTFDPPKPVWVDLAKAYAHLPAQVDGTSSPTVRDKGMTFKDTVVGELHAWVRTPGGAWLGLVSYTVKVFAAGGIPVRDLVARSTIAERGKGETEPPF
jgi:hypothetical protein